MVPAGVQGCALPVYVQIDDTISNFVTMAVGNAGAQCVNPSALTPAQIQAATQNGGIRSASLGVTYFSGQSGTSAPDVSESVGALFAKTPLSALSGFSAVAPVGNCIVYQFPVPVPAGLNTYLDAGNVSVSGVVGPYNLYSATTGQYGLTFMPGGASSPGLITDGTVLGPGTYTFTGSGGADVGAFSASLNYVNTFQWDQSSLPSAINRSQPLTINWTGGTAGATVSITITSSLGHGTVSDFGSVLSCYVDATLETFTLPTVLLSALPPSYTDANGNPQATIDVTENSASTSFTASGLDFATISFELAFTRGFIAVQ